jgi:hypothetical protein
MHNQWADQPFIVQLQAVAGCLATVTRSRMLARDKLC